MVCGIRPLKNQFRRLYSFSIQKFMKIEECGVWDGLSWQWDLPCRRELFEWEKELANILYLVLTQANMGREHQDRRIWCHQNSRMLCYSCE